MKVSTALVNIDEEISIESLEKYKSTKTPSDIKYS